MAAQGNGPLCMLLNNFLQSKETLFYSKALAQEPFAASSASIHEVAEDSFLMYMRRH